LEEHSGTSSSGNEKVIHTLKQAEISLLNKYLLEIHTYVAQHTKKVVGIFSNGDSKYSGSLKTTGLCLVSGRCATGLILAKADFMLG